jgi:hypothetical protein
MLIPLAHSCCCWRHRDGTVYSAVTLAELAAPEQLYRKLGAKLVVGMPFKDIATSDGVFLREVRRRGQVSAGGLWCGELRVMHVLGLETCCCCEQGLVHVDA